MTSPPTAAAVDVPRGGTRSEARRDPLALASVAAIALVVALVSLPSLRSFALRQNETDAVSIVRALAEAVGELGARGGPGSLAGDPRGTGARPMGGRPLRGGAGARRGRPAPSAARLLEAEPALRHRFADLETVGTGGLVRCHGYLFEIVAGAAGAVARAWPWEHGRTGHAAFVATADGRVLGHPNGNGRWSGPDARLPERCEPSAGWRPVRD